MSPLVGWVDGIDAFVAGLQMSRVGLNSACILQHRCISFALSCILHLDTPVYLSLFCILHC